MIRQKKCEGTHASTKGYGCGKMVNVENRIYGLGKMCCYGEWLFSSENGRLKLDKAMSYGKKKVVKEQKEKDNAIRESLHPKSYFEGLLQKEINQIVKYLDAGWGCIATNTKTGKRNAGHYFSIGSNPTLRYHLENIWNQSEHSNTHKSGDTLRYQDGIVSLCGQEYLNHLNGLKMIQPIKLTVDEIKEKTSIARGIVKWLKLQDRKYTLEERLEYRVKFNEQIGIYK